MIYIPVSALTIRMINHDYPSVIIEGKLSPPRRHFLSDLLLSTAGNDFLSLHPDTLCYKLPVTVYSYRDPFFVGNQLHKWAIDSMCRFIDHHQQYIGTWAASRQFVQYYSLEDHEYSIETAFRTYNKWNKRRTDAQPCVSAMPGVSDPRIPLDRFTSDHHQHTPQQISTLSGKIIREHLHLFYSKRGIFMHRKVRSLTRYLMYFHFGYRHSDIASFHKCTYKAVVTSIHTTAKFVSSHHSIHKSILDLAS